MYAQQLSIDDCIRNVIRNIDNADIEVTVDDYCVGQAAMQIRSLHEKDDGYVTIAIKRENNWYQHHYTGNELEKNIDKVLSIDGINIYLSPNSFYKPFRRIQNIRKLNALYIDLDYYNIENFKGLEPEQIIYILDKDYFKRHVPEASFIVMTGRGIAIYWLIEPVPHMVIPLWNAVQKFFLQELKEIGADPKSIDAARVMRLSGSVNQKNGQAVEILNYNTDYKYTLREIQEEYMPKLTPYVKNPGFRKKGRKPKIVKLYTLYQLHYARLMDVVKLQKIRNGYCRNENNELIETGQRELMCFLYRYWACCFSQNKEKAIEDALDFNKEFVCPLSENEVRSQTRAAESAYEEWKLNDFNIKKKKKDSDKLEIDPELKKKADAVRKNRPGYKLLGYNYTNETLIEQLCINKEEMKQLKTIIDKGEVKRRDNESNKARQKAKRRNKDGLTKREQAKLKKVEAIKELKEKGYTQRQIANKLNLGIATVKRYYKEIQKKVIL